MSQDISRILKDWDYDPDEISARIVRGDDGREKIQLRVELGILQMEIDGRPDGARPENSESWLDHARKRQRLHDVSHPDGPPFRLNETQCMRLWREGVQYYHRYVAFWHLEQYGRCARDTARTLRLFAFVRPCRAGAASGILRPVAALRDDDARPGRRHAAVEQQGGGSGACR